MRKLRHGAVKGHDRDHTLSTLSQLMVIHPSCPSAVGENGQRCSSSQNSFIALSGERTCSEKWKEGKRKKAGGERKEEKRLERKDRRR